MSDTPRTDAAKIACGFQAVPDSFLEHARKLERENAVLREALVKIRELKPINMACDHWNKQLCLETDEVFDICDAAIDAARKEQP
jgi:hypothetical protein